MLEIADPIQRGLDSGPFRPMGAEKGQPCSPKRPSPQDPAPRAEDGEPRGGGGADARRYVPEGSLRKAAEPLDAAMKVKGRKPARRWLTMAVTGTALGLLSACALNLPRVDGVPVNSLSPAVPWTPPRTEEQKPTKAGPAVPIEEVQARLQKLTLADVVDIALQNNPATRAAWAEARAAAANYGSSKGAYYPTLNLGGSLSRFKRSSPKGTGEASFGGGGSSSGPMTTYGGAASLSYLLFDFGGRSGLVEESRQALFASDWTHNAVIQDTVLGVEVAFFNYAAARALLAANQVSLQEAKTNLAAAEERHRVGLATIADVLQAKTAYSEVKLLVQTTEGAVRNTRGALAVSMGYPANVPYDVRVETPEIPSEGLAQTIDGLIDQVLTTRPDLLAARSHALESAAKVKEARSNMLPSLSLSGSAGRTWIDDLPGFYDDYNAALLAHIPVFNGFSYQYDLMKAKAEAEAAEEHARRVEEQVIYQVFAAHSDFLTASERVKTADDLVASGVQSEEVALGRYREGVGNILDLLSAQRVLAVARAQQISARLGWFTALAQLAHDVGILGLHGENPLAPKGLSLPR